MFGGEHIIAEQLSRRCSLRPFTTAFLFGRFRIGCVYSNERIRAGSRSISKSSEPGLLWTVERIRILLSSSKNSEKNLDSYLLCKLFLYLFFVSVLKVNDEKSRILIH